MKKLRILFVFLLCLSQMIQAQEVRDKGKNKATQMKEPYHEVYPDDALKGRLQHEQEMFGESKKSIYNSQAIIWESFTKYQQTHNLATNAKVENINAAWSFFGPQQVTAERMTGIGRVNCIFPLTGSTWFIGAAQGGLWKTTNSGSSWTCLTDGLPDMCISDIAVDPNNNNIIYILTGDGDGNFPSVGVLKSLNGGTTWFSTGLTFDRSQDIKCYRMTMDPFDSQTLLVASTDGLYFTNDAAFTWGKVVNSPSMRDIEFRPGTPGWVVVTTTNQILYQIMPDPTYYVANINGIGIGKTFADYKTTRIAIDFSPANPLVVYAIVADSNTSTFGIFQSLDGGQSFNSTNQGIPNILGAQGTYDIAISADPLNANTVYAGGIFLYRSINGGATFTKVADQGTETLPYCHPDIHNIAWASSSEMLVGSDGGLYYSSDAVTTMSELVDDLTITQLYHVASFPGNTGKVIAGAQDVGILSDHDADNVYINTVQVDGQEARFLSGDSIIIAAGQNGRTYLSSNGGELFSQAGFPDHDNGVWDTPMEQFPGYPTVYVCTDTIWRGTYFNDELTWSVHCTIPTPTSLIIEAEIAPSNVDYFYYYTRYKNAADETVGAFYRSKNFSGNKTFLLRNESTNWVSVSDMIVDPQNPERLWITLADYNDGKKVYKSTNSGKTWQNISGSLPNVKVMCITKAPTGSNALYIGTDIGVFYRNDDLSDWIYFSNGLPVVRVRELEIHENEGFIRAATYGRGIWDSPLFDGSCEDFVNVTDGENDEGINVLQVSEYITSTAVINSGVGTEVTYDAGEYVVLQEGFEVKELSTFWAHNDGCNDILFKTVSPVSGTFAGPMPPPLTYATEERTLLDVYPNPSSGDVTVSLSIEMEARVAIIVTDATGKIVLAPFENFLITAGENLIQLNLRHLPDGVYQILISGDGINSLARLTLVK